MTDAGREGLQAMTMSLSDADPRLLPPSRGRPGPGVVVHENPWFSVRRRGKAFTMEYRDPQVIILPVVEDRAVVMVRVWRPVIADHILELPSGGFAVGESVRQAAARELAEETGIVVADLERFTSLPAIAESPDRIPDLLHILRVDLDRGEYANRKPHDQEVLHVARVDYPRAVRLLRHGDIYAAGTVAALARHLLDRMAMTP